MKLIKIVTAVVVAMVLGTGAQAFQAGKYKCSINTEMVKGHLVYNLQRNGNYDFRYVGSGTTPDEFGGEWKSKGNKAKLYENVEGELQQAGFIYKSKRGYRINDYFGDRACKKIR